VGLTLLNVQSRDLGLSGVLDLLLHILDGCGQALLRVVVEADAGKLDNSDHSEEEVDGGKPRGM
jgi:hypothetical protein